MSIPAELLDAVLDDPRRRARIEAIIDRAIDDAEYIMEWGTETQRVALMKSMVPNLLRSLRRQQDAETDKKSSEAYQELRHAFRAHIKERTVSE